MHPDSEIDYVALKCKFQGTLKRAMACADLPAVYYCDDWYYHRCYHHRHYCCCCYQQIVNRGGDMDMGRCQATSLSHNMVRWHALIYQLFIIAMIGTIIIVIITVTIVVVAINRL